ncbi:hypothetical protein EGLA_04720 [Enterococcus gallinarum]|nr:hypothetical protein AH4_18180 [Enterococcus gallinarum]
MKNLFENLVLFRLPSAIIKVFLIKIFMMCYLLFLDFLLYSDNLFFQQNNRTTIIRVVRL